MKKIKPLSTFTANLRLKTLKEALLVSNQLKTNNLKRKIRMDREEYFVWDNQNKNLKLMTFQI
jgi:hypothetical protein